MEVLRCDALEAGEYELAEELEQQRDLTTYATHTRPRKAWGGESTPRAVPPSLPLHSALALSPRRYFCRRDPTHTPTACTTAPFSWLHYYLINPDPNPNQLGSQVR